MASESKKLEWIQIAISVATLVLTPFISALLVKYQLSSSQTYWEQQQAYEVEKEKREARIAVLKEAVGAATRLQDCAREYCVYFSSRETALALAKAMKESNPEAAKSFEGEHEDYRTRVSEAYLEGRELSAKLTEHALLIQLYFDDALSQKLIAFRDKTKKAMTPAMSRPEIEELVSKAKADSATARVAEQAISAEYDRRQESRYAQAELADFVAAAVKALDANDLAITPVP